MSNKNAYTLVSEYFRFVEIRWFLQFSNWVDKIIKMCTINTRFEFLELFLKIGVYKMNGVERVVNNLSDAVIKLADAVKSLAEASKNHDKTIGFLQQKIAHLETRVKKLEEGKADKK